MVQEFVNSMASYGEKETDERGDVYDIVIRVSAAMLCGKHLKRNNEFVTPMKEVDILGHHAKLPLVKLEYDFFPWLRHFGLLIFQEIVQINKGLATLWFKMKKIVIDSYNPSGDAM